MCTPQEGKIKQYKVLSVHQLRRLHPAELTQAKAAAVWNGWSGSIYLSICLLIYWLYFSIDQSMYPSAILSVYQSVCLSFYLIYSLVWSTCSISLSLFINLSVCLSVCLQTDKHKHDYAIISEWCCTAIELVK